VVNILSILVGLIVTSPCHAGDTPPLYSTIYIDKLLSVSLDSLRVKVSASVRFAGNVFPIMGIRSKIIQSFIVFPLDKRFSTMKESIQH
jgi:hypothetical protein